MKKYLKLTPLTISIIVIVLGIITFLAGVPFLDIIELKTIDLRFLSRGNIAPGPEIILAVIDEKSLDQEGKWIWPRSKLADMVNKISMAGAKVIAFDIGFLEPDDKEIIRTITQIQREAEQLNILNTPFENYLKDLKLQSDYDKTLADAIKNSSAKVVLGYFFQTDSADPVDMNEEKILAHIENIKGSMYKIIRYKSANAKDIPLIETQVPHSNIREIASATDYCGFFNILPDPDGVVRWIPGVFKYKDMLYSPLSFIAASAYLDTPLSIKMSEYGIEKITIGKLSIPTDDYGRAMINYRGETKTFPHIPITDILRGKVSDNLLRDKIVLVGATAVGIYDMRVTPFGSVFPGLEIHANVVDNILSNNFLFQPGWTTILDVMIIIFTGLSLGLVLPRTGVVSGSVVVFLLFAGYILFCQYMFSQHGLIFNLVYPLSVIVIIYIGITSYRYFMELKQKKFIKNVFSTYVAPSVVKHLVESPENLVLGGEEREITAFFSDIQGFTSISENLTPKEVVELLNEFLTEMTDVILNYEGTVDKFEGDAIIAFFGAPNYLENQAETACMACVEMQKKLAELRSKWKKEGKPELLMRIGLNTGPAVVGNMGTKSRMDYTMMGDTVNTAARLEGVNKIYGTYTLISEITCRAAGDWSLVREVDSVYFAGKNEPVTIYELLGYPGDVDKNTHETLDYYKRGLNAYRRRDWNRAIMFLLKALSLTPDDGPSNTMLARCNTFKTNPPNKGWNGAFRLAFK